MAHNDTTDAGGDRLGVIMVLLSELLLASVNAIIKYLHNWSTQKIMIIRNAVDLCLSLAMCAVFRYELPRRKVAMLLFLRGFCYIAFIWFFFASLHSCLPLGDVIVSVVTFNPIFLVLLSRLVLGEQIPRKWPAQFALCVIGALLINKPLAPDPTCPASNALLPMAAALSGALTNLASRKVKDVPPAVVCVCNDTVALSFAIVTTAITSDLTSLLPDVNDCSLGLAVLAGIIGWAGLLSNIKGYQSVSVSAIATLAAYISVPLGYVIQVAVFGEALDMCSAAGAAIIACTNMTVIISSYYGTKTQIDKQARPHNTLLLDEAVRGEQAVGA